VLAITKNGINIGNRLIEIFPNWDLYAPRKLQNGKKINWYNEPTSEKLIELFKNYEGLICIFSLGAVIRLISPYLKDKKIDPAVVVIDDKANFVISVLSGHLGGANELTQTVAQKLNSTPVITTAADVNKTIAVDLLGRNLGWKIEDDSNVTKISALMVNEEKIGVYQDAGQTKWYEKLPSNVFIFENLDELKKSNSKGCLIISDKNIEESFRKNAVIYRPPTLVIGIGLHWDTPKQTIEEGIKKTLSKFNLNYKSIAKLASIKKSEDVPALIDLGKEMQIPIELIDRDELAQIPAPNPSEMVRAYEGTSSVSEAAAIKVSKGKLIVEKQKFPPNLTIAIARISN
jgi:cobalt-precorrin 5A hydrolase